MTYSATDTDDDNVVEADVNNEVTNTDHQEVTESITLWNGSGPVTYPGDTQGLRSAVSDATANYRLSLPPGDFDLGTTGITFPAKGLVEGVSMARGTRIIGQEGIGTAVTVGGGTVLRDLNVFGPYSGTATDTGIAGTTGDGFSRFYNVKVSGWPRGVYMDAHFNSVWVGSMFNRSQGDAAAASHRLAAAHFDVASGSNNNTRIVSPYFASNQVASLIIEANEVGVYGWQSEANTAKEIDHVFGAGIQVHGVRVQSHDSGGTAIDVNDGPCTYSVIDMGASASGGTAINIADAAAGDAKVSGPFHFSGWNTNVSGAASTGSVTQHDS